MTNMNLLSLCFIWNILCTTIGSSLKLFFLSTFLMCLASFCITSFSRILFTLWSLYSSSSLINSSVIGSLTSVVRHIKSPFSNIVYYLLSFIRENLYFLLSTIFMMLPLHQPSSFIQFVFFILEFDLFNCNIQNFIRVHSESFAGFQWTWTVYGLCVLGISLAIF